jgi:hypothetical protein
MMSGIYSGPVLTRIAAPDPRFGPPTVTLSTGRVVSNPLATTFRYAYGTRGEGQFQTPTLHRLNIRIGRDFVIGRQRLETAIDIFNVTNHDADQQVNFGGNQLQASNYRTFFNRQYARSAQFVVRFVF